MPANIIDITVSHSQFYVQLPTIPIVLTVSVNEKTIAHRKKTNEHIATFAEYRIFFAISFIIDACI